MTLEHIQARTTHARRGAIRNAFAYGVDFVLVEPDAPSRDWPRAIARNRFALWSLHDRHHGGERGKGEGAAWFRRVLAARGFSPETAQIVLLTQPSFLWFHFNPVSFWIALIDGTPRAFVAEVNNTFGQRHCYFCAHDDFRPICPTDRLEAEKLMHVSPFQRIAGSYVFSFGLTAQAVNIGIRYQNVDQGVLATLSGPRRKATSRSLLRAAVRRPFGAARVVALILWQAAILRIKRAPFLRRQPPPAQLVSQGRFAPEVSK